MKNEGQTSDFHGGPNGTRIRLEVVPMTIKACAPYIRRWHRHHAPPKGGLWAVGCRVVGATEVCGVAVVARPNARLAQDGETVDVVRVATDGTPNACSFLYGVCRRAAQVLGWKRVNTYTLPSESGASLRAIGLRDEDAVKTRGGSWDRPGRARTDKAPTVPKLRHALVRQKKGEA